mmetsp:Transcript_17651/g.50186  ORF Transcript_17651/g.50186 Transcript_17651/m.50186 type:complete len:208 (-) Transcript_17651:401-1024(-)
MKERVYLPCPHLSVCLSHFAEENLFLVGVSGGEHLLCVGLRAPGQEVLQLVHRHLPRPLFGEVPHVFVAHALPRLQLPLLHKRRQLQRDVVKVYGALEVDLRHDGRDPQVLEENVRRERRHGRHRRDTCRAMPPLLPAPLWGRWHVLVLFSGPWGGLLGGVLVLVVAIFGWGEDEVVEGPDEVLREVHTQRGRLDLHRIKHLPRFAE